MIKRLLTLPASLPPGQKTVLWIATTILCSAMAFTADSLGVPRPIILAAVVLLIVPITAGAAKWLSAMLPRRERPKAKGAQA